MVRSRPVPGTGVSVSELSFDLGSGRGPARHSADDSVAVLVRRAVAAGITLFDVSRMDAPWAIGSLIDRALDTAQRVGALIVPFADAQAPGSSTAGADGLRTRSGGRLTLFERGPSLAEGDSGSKDFTPAQAGTESPADASHRIFDWRTDLAAETAIEPPAVGTLQLWMVRANLLSSVPLRIASETTTKSGDGLFVRDPFAGGRLVGRGAGAEASPLGARSGPIPLETLQAQWAPVLQLKFLTEGRRRSLPVAALQYAISFPGVVSVLVPFESVSDLRWVEEVGQAPPLTEDELKAVESPRPASGPFGPA